MTRFWLVAARWMRLAMSRTVRREVSRPRGRQLYFETLEPRVMMSAKLFGGLSTAIPVTGPDDSFEENDTRATAFNAGTLTGPQSFNDLVLKDDDWIRFQLGKPGSLKDYAKISFSHSQGDIDFELYDSTGVKLRESASESSSETVSLYGLSAGVNYYLRAFGYNGAQNPRYSGVISAVARTTSTRTMTRMERPRISAS